VVEIFIQPIVFDSVVVNGYKLIVNALEIDLGLWLNFFIAELVKEFCY
jgi:hypothetical protein